MSQVPSMSKTCTIPPNVSYQTCPDQHPTHLYLYSAKKEDNPEEAIKEFRSIVEHEEEKGDW